VSLSALVTFRLKAGKKFKHKAPKGFPKVTKKNIKTLCSLLLRAKLNEQEMAGINGTGRPKKEARAGLMS
jgi:hypothetical protein